VILNYAAKRRKQRRKILRNKTNFDGAYVSWERVGGLSMPSNIILVTVLESIFL